MKNRFLNADRALQRKERALIKKLGITYAESLREIRHKIADLNAKHDLTINEMYKYNRLKTLENEVQKELTKLSNKNNINIFEHLKDTFEESFYRTGFILETEIQAKLRFTKLNPVQVRKAIENPLSDLALQRSRANVIISVNQAIAQGLISGEGYRKISKRLNKVMEGNLNDTFRIARTETHRVQQQSRLDAFEHVSDQGVIMGKTWISSLDNRTRDTHQELDGQTVAMDEEFESPSGATAEAPGQFGVAEEDINCRCSFYSVIKGFEPEFRRVKGEGVVPYTNYKEWKEARIDE